MSQQSPNVGKHSIGDIFPSKQSSASVPSLHHVPHSPSLTSLAHSEGDIPLYAPTLVQDPSIIDLPTQSDIIIAVIGSTGAGKSTFINKAVGIEETEVGHLLSSCTQTIQIVRCFDTQQNRQIVLVDTPGFNDTNMSDLDTLQLVANWLKLTYEKGIHLSGLLFFHRISDNRMGGSVLKYHKMFQNLCGNEALKNVVLVTTMWDEVEEEEGRDRETELSTKYWKTMLDLGCRTSRFYNNTESARDIVSQFQDARCTVLLQRELVDLHLELAETSAGRTLFSLLIEFIKKIKELIAQLESKLKQNQHSENRTVVEQNVTATKAILRDADVRRRRYSVPSSVFRRFSNSRILGPSTAVNDRRPLVSAALFHPSAPDNSSSATPRSKTTPAAETPCVNALFSLTSSPTTECFSPPPSPADGIGQTYSTCTVLQGTITALKLVQQIVGLAPVPGLQSLVGLVLNVAEIVNNMNAAEDALIELARKAGSFMVTLVDQESISSFSDSDAMKSIIEGLTKEMERVLRVVTRISSKRLANRLLLSAFDKAAVDDCNRQMALACGIFGIQIAFISQKAIARIEAKLNLVLNIPPQLNNQTTTVQRSTTC